LRIPSARTRHKIVVEIAKAASGLTNPEEMELPQVNEYIARAARNVALQLRHLLGSEKILYCTVCGRGPFRPRGYYLHLVRLHYDEIVARVEDEAERLLASSHS